VTDYLVLKRSKLNKKSAAGIKKTLGTCIIIKSLKPRQDLYHEQVADKFFFYICVSNVHYLSWGTIVIIIIIKSGMLRHSHDVKACKKEDKLV